MIVTIVSVLPCTVNAASGDNTISPRWQNTGSVSCLIGLPGDGYAYAEGNVMGHPTATHITGDVYVYRQVGSSWVYVGEAHEAINDWALIISCKFKPIEGAYYRADFTFVVTKNGVDETITQTKYRRF